MADNPGIARLRAVFVQAAAENRAALLPYMTAGLPSRSASVGLFEAMAEAGADAFEVGIPYSDPLMDGPTIHEAGLAALAAGTSLEGGLEVVEQVTAATGKPVIVMSYVNPVLRMGTTAFGERAAAAGASAVILADLRWTSRLRSVEPSMMPAWERFSSSRRRRRVSGSRPSPKPIPSSCTASPRWGSPVRGKRRA